MIEHCCNICIETTTNSALRWWQLQAPAAADVDLQFRLYRQTSGNRALLQCVALPQHILDKVHNAPGSVLRSSSLLRSCQQVDGHDQHDT